MLFQVYVLWSITGSVTVSEILWSDVSTAGGDKMQTDMIGAL